MTIRRDPLDPNERELVREGAPSPAGPKPRRATTPPAHAARRASPDTPDTPTGASFPHSTHIPGIHVHTGYAYCVCGKGTGA